MQFIQCVIKLTMDALIKKKQLNQVMAITYLYA